MAAYSETIKRLRDAGSGLFDKRVFGAAALDDLIDKRGVGATLPAIYVVLSSEQPSVASVLEEITVVVAVDPSRDPLGDKATEQLLAVRDVLLAQLEGWKPTTAHRQMTWNSAELVAFNSALLMWQYVFQVVRERKKLVSVSIRFIAEISSGVTVAAAETAVAAKIEASIAGATRLDSDYLQEELAAIASGATRYQLKQLVGGELVADSNRTRDRLHVQIDLHHRVTDGNTERSHTEGAMQTDVRVLLDPDTWRDMPEIYALEEEPTLEFPGDVIRQ